MTVTRYGRKYSERTQNKLRHIIITTGDLHRERDDTTICSHINTIQLISCHLDHTAGVIDSKHSIYCDSVTLTLAPALSTTLPVCASVSVPNWQPGHCWWSYCDFQTMNSSLDSKNRAVKKINTVASLV